MLPRLTRRRSKWRVAGRVAALAAGAGMLAAGFLEAVREPGTDAEEANGRRTVVVLDLSASVRVEDARTEDGRNVARVERARSLATALVRRSPGRTGLVAYAERARVLLPMSSDPEAALSELRSAATPGAAGGGSRPARGLKAAHTLLRTGEGGGRVVLFTDGEAEPGSLERAVRGLARDDVRLDLVGLGSVEGDRVPAPAGSGRRWLTDARGRNATARLHRRRLSKLTAASGVRFIEPGGEAPAAVAGELAGSRPAVGGESRSRPTRESSGSASVYLLGAFALLWLESLFLPGPAAGRGA